MVGIGPLQTFEAFLGVALLLFAYGYMYRRTRLDRYREDLFSIRDRLFDYMWKHGLSYDLPAYRVTRDMLNGGIRVAQSLSLPVILAFVCLSRGKFKDSGVVNAINSIEDDTTRMRFLEVYREVASRTFTYLCLEGPQWIVFKPIQLLLRHAARDSAEKPLVLKRIRVRAYHFAYQATDGCTNEFVAFGRKDSSEAQILGRTARAH